MGRPRRRRAVGRALTQVQHVGVSRSRHSSLLRRAADGRFGRGDLGERILHDNGTYLAGDTQAKISWSGDPWTLTSHSGRAFSSRGRTSSRPHQVSCFSASAGLSMRCTTQHAKPPDSTKTSNPICFTPSTITPSIVRPNTTHINQETQPIAKTLHPPHRMAVRGQDRLLANQSPRQAWS